MQKRCAWAEGGDLNYIQYHNTEWGVPVHDDRKLFEFIVLESAQAGLSWRTILNKRVGYRKAFKNFDPKKVAKMTEHDVSQLLLDPCIVRNGQKIRATINNAKQFLTIAKEFGSFDSYMWSWTNGVPVQNAYKHKEEVPAVTDLAIKMSKDLKERGFKFLGPTIWYAHMQACGMVNDHMTDCFRYREVSLLR
jgi:DNA-3-methyladenine glycosylase I